MAPKRKSMLDNLKHVPVKEPASWAKAMDVRSTNVPGEYLAEAYPDWTFGGVLHGGVVFALCVEAAKVHIQSKESIQHQTDAVSSQITLLRPTRVGKLHIKVDDLKTGAQYSIFRVSTYQPDSKTKALRQCVETTVVLGNLDKEASNSAALKIPASNKPLHVDITKTKPSRDGWQLEHLNERKVPFYTSKGYKCLHPPGQELEAGSQSHPVYGPFVRENWWKADEPWTCAHLPYLLDLGTPMHMNFDDGHGYWGPTLSMSLDLKKRPPKSFHMDGKESGSEWLFQQVELEEFKDGRMMIHMLLKDEEGDTLAVIKMVNIAVPYNRVGTESKSNSQRDSRL